MNESFMFIFIFTVLALGEKYARFVQFVLQFIHVSFTELVNLNGFMNMLDTLTQVAHALPTRVCTHTHILYTYIYVL